MWGLCRGEMRKCPGRTDTQVRMWRKLRVVVGAGPRGPDSCWNSLEEPLKRKDRVRQPGPEGE